ncbi:uncharacterized protein RpL14 [Penaeus vannamei]|uniref:Large ribosomal subunit protein eL14 n=1 Tax=Penaeus vannamei TaxID=6689 RepID=A0A423SKL5_PENVA|nr:60S ribosomal protein L14-like [Penaeus vannamei]ROT64766.1 putative 60S ribosomal protein L14 [Penaeus vannamei]
MFVKIGVYIRLLLSDDVQRSSRSRRKSATMPFKKFAQIGRVIYINEGQYKGKLAVIVDIIDTNRALIDGPCHGVPRQQFKFCEMRLTTYVLKICRGMRTKLIRAAWEEAKISEKFEASTWNKNINKGLLRSSMTDFDRFKLGRAKQARNKIVKSAYLRLKRNILIAKRPTVKAARKLRGQKLAKKKELKEKKPKTWKPRKTRGPRAARNKAKPAKTVKAAK